MKWLAIVALLAGCAEEEGKFPVVVNVVSDDGAPLADLPVIVGKTPAGKTGPDGKLKMRVLGKEGSRVAISVATPKGYRAVSTANAVILRRLADIEGAPGGSGHTLSIEHVVKFAPLQRQYAVLIRTDQPNVTVETFGTRQAVTNDKGVAMFLYDGTPGDELQVKLVTEGRADLRPQNPTQSFLLAARSEAYLVKEHFTVAKKAAKKRPTHVGPKRL
ncbi:MAG: hypothetical protein JWN44_2021 [Myxococcales bacterium]|nr:hypothetical protein [Myxococcales bacterium]